MQNDRGVIRGQEAYLKQTDVAFKDRAEPQRCTTTEDSNGASIPGDKRQISLYSPFFHVAVNSGARPREDRSLSEDARADNEAQRRGPSALGFPNYTQ